MPASSIVSSTSSAATTTSWTVGIGCVSSIASASASASTPTATAAIAPEMRLLSIATNTVATTNEACAPIDHNILHKFDSGVHCWFIATDIDLHWGPLWHILIDVHFRLSFPLNAADSVPATPNNSPYAGLGALNCHSSSAWGHACRASTSTTIPTAIVPSASRD